MVTNSEGDPLYPHGQLWSQGKKALAVLWEVNVGSSFVGEASLTYIGGRHHDVTAHYKAHEPAAPFANINTISYQTLITVTHDAMRLSQKQHDCHHKILNSLAEGGSAVSANASRVGIGSSVQEWEDYQIDDDTSFLGRFPLTPLPIRDPLESVSEGQSESLVQLKEKSDTDDDPGGSLFTENPDVFAFGDLIAGSDVATPTQDLSISLSVENIDNKDWTLKMIWSVHVEDNTGAPLPTKIPLASDCWSGNSLVDNAVTNPSCWETTSSQAVSAHEKVTISWTLEGARHLSCLALLALTAEEDGPIDEQHHIRVDFSAAVEQPGSQSYNDEKSIRFATGMDLVACRDQGAWNR